MAIAATTAQQATLGIFGSTLLHGDGQKIDLKTSGKGQKYVCAITMLDDTTFESLTNLDETNLSNACISTIDGEDETDSVWQSATNNTSNFSTIVTTSHKFPKGITIYGKWNVVELNSGSAVCYLAPNRENIGKI